MNAIRVSRGSSEGSRAGWSVKIAAAAAIFAAVSAVVAFGANGAHKGPPIAAALPALDRASVDPSPGSDPSVPSAQSVFDVRTRVLPDELPPSF